VSDEGPGLPSGSGQLAQAERRSADIRPAARRGARLGLVAGLASQALSVVATLVLVRLLAPDAFGIVAAVNSAVGLISVVTQFGLGIAIVRSSDASDEVVGTLFWTSVAVGAVASVATGIGAQPLAALMGVPSAAPYLAVLAVTILLHMASAVPRALIQRRLRFKRLYGIQTGAMVAYVVTQVSLASVGAGAWSVITGQIVNATVLLVGFLVGAGWKPRLVFSPSVLGRVVGFSGSILATTLLTHVLKNADYWVVGRRGGAAVLGFYYVAYVLPNIVRLRITTTAIDVLLPVFSEVRHDANRLRRAFLSSLRLQMFVGCPALLGISVLAPLIVTTFFGAKWRDAVLPMQVLSVAAIVDVAMQPVVTIFIAAGVPGRSLRVVGVRLAVFLALLATLARGDGLGPVAVAVLIASVVGAFVGYALVRRHVQLSGADLVGALGPPLVCGTAMVAVLSIADDLVGLPPPLALAVLVPLGAAVYLGVGFVIFRRATLGALSEARAIAGLRQAGPTASAGTEPAPIAT
jgi:O-antigen/teichoic acid export membrane protein